MKIKKSKKEKTKDVVNMLLGSCIKIFLLRNVELFIKETVKLRSKILALQMLN